MSDLVQQPMGPKNFGERVRSFIDKKKQQKDNPVIPMSRMPGDMAKMFEEARKKVR